MVEGAEGNRPAEGAGPDDKLGPDEELEQVEGVGKSVDEAIENALDELGLERDEVEIEVLAEGGPDAEARVLVTALPYEDDEDFDDELEAEEFEDEADVEGGPAPGAGDEDRRAGPAAPAARMGAPSAPGATRGAAPEAGRGAASGARPRAERPAGPPASSADAQAAAELAQGILAELLDRMELPSEIVVDEVEVDDGLPSVRLSIEGEFGGILIGRHGDTLSALQFLLGLMTSRRAGRRVRVVVDVEGYRERRERLLQDMATRAAERAQRYRQPIFMDPMMPNERRIVHMTLKDHPGVSTHSIGEGDGRRVVVSPREARRFGGYGVE